MVTTHRRNKEPTSKRAEVEARVLEGTDALLAEGATFPELSVERIATRAGLGRTGFYFYFADKQDVLMRLTHGVAEQLYQEADRWWHGGEPGDPAMLGEALRRVVLLYAEHPLLIRAVIEAAASEAEVATLWRTVTQRFIDATRERIEREQQAGHAAGLDPTATASALVWMVERSVYQRIAQGLDATDAAFVGALVDVWTRTIYGRL